MADGSHRSDYGTSHASVSRAFPLSRRSMLLGAGAAMGPIFGISGGLAAEKIFSGGTLAEKPIGDDISGEIEDTTVLIGFQSPGSPKMGIRVPLRALDPDRVITLPHDADVFDVSLVDPGWSEGTRTEYSKIFWRFAQRVLVRWNEYETVFTGFDDTRPDWFCRRRLLKSDPPPIPEHHRV